MFQFTIRLNRTVLGMIAVGIVVAISSFSIVRAEITPDKSKTFSCSSGTACVAGSSTGSKTWGVYGISVGADGVHGVTSSTNGDSAVAGISTGTSGSAHGVYGGSSNGVGVYGTSSAGYGVEGRSSAMAGVYGYSNASGGYGVVGETNSDGEAIQAVADKSNTFIIYGFNKATGGFCYIDAKAHLYCSGGIASDSALQVQQRNSSGQRLLTYASESATATIEDVGTARMYDGVANVQISPDFASVMDGKWYYIFLTPLGDTRGLYVSMKNTSGFQVRETERGRDALSFDYRIVAHPLGAKNDRLPLAPAGRQPKAMHPTQ